MVILSDCLTEKIDEGCIKVANSLTKRIKEAKENTLVLSYKSKPDNSDIHLKLNKFFLNKKLFSIINKDNDMILYIPFASNTKGSAIRIWIMSLFVKTRIRVIFVLRFSMDNVTKKLLKKSGAQIVALSRESFEYYNSEIGNAFYLKTGIDTNQFRPVDKERKMVLRKKYGVVDGKKVLLHVGHLKSGRNVDKLLDVSSDYHVFLVISSVTEKDNELRRVLLSRPNTTIIDTYLENIEEVYQMADVYLFPVQQNENCIDVPLSVLEAAACNIPVVTTEYGELKEFVGKSGFKFIRNLDKNTLNMAIDEMSALDDCNNRESTMEYDWQESIKKLI